MDIYNNLAQKDQNYFRESREKLLGKALEEIVINRDERLPRFQKSLNPLRRTLKNRILLQEKLRAFLIISFLEHFSGHVVFQNFLYLMPMILCTPGVKRCLTFMMDWPGRHWDTQSEKDTANQSNADINNQNITLVCQSSDRDNLLFKIRSSSWFPLLRE